MKSLSAADLIAQLKLEPHPEGGFYRETYRAPVLISEGELAPHFKGARAFSTAIYFLIPAGGRSRLHRIKSDEIWHFYAGDPLKIVEITPNGVLKETKLGLNLAQSEIPQYMVSAGHWFGAEATGENFTLVGCTVAPGFEFADFELAERDRMLKEFPRAAAWIKKLT